MELTAKELKETQIFCNELQKGTYDAKDDDSADLRKCKKKI